ncbi:MAG: hypothetical protein VKS61_03435 [Candidatus Sericytochromatia bacterium]|nr:hypothetical protein [Candidatus Sericytochromatia bacterium]
MGLTVYGGLSGVDQPPSHDTLAVPYDGRGNKYLHLFDQAGDLVATADLASDSDPPPDPQDPIRSWALSGDLSASETVQSNGQDFDITRDLGASSVDALAVRADGVSIHI